MPARSHTAVVVLLRGNPADWLWRMHASADVLGGTVGVLDLVVHGRDVLASPEAIAAPMALGLASFAGLSQVFSP